ncbi:box C/D snoRNA protein 1, partial [Lates japonicus]
MSAEDSREEISRQEDEEQRGTKRKISLSNCGVCGSEEAKYRCPGCLTHSCSARKMNITLRLLPITFTKSKENSTFFHTKEKRFMWHLKLIFPQSSTEFSQRRVSDRQTLEQILTPYIHPTESDPVTCQKLKMYVHATFDNVKVFMKAEGRKANSVRYHELDMQKSLRDNLSYKTLIEYPVLHIVLREHWKDYPLKGP